MLPASISFALVVLLALLPSRFSLGQDQVFLPEYDMPAPIARAESANASPMPTYMRTPRHIDPDDQTQRIARQDSVDEASMLREMSRIYQLHGEILGAMSRYENELVEELFDIVLEKMGSLSRHDYIVQQPRYRELYRTVITELEGYYGFSDSLFVERGDIFAFRDLAFSYINEDTPLIEDVALPSLTLTETTVPMPINERVKSSMVFLLTDPDRHINHWLNRAETYFPMIETILEEEGVPDEIKYLAMVESGLNPRARSWARAVGMWQFIRGTGRAYDLESNGWVDDRMNPEKATRAAARHLRDLYNRFGDWHLAMAGYNYSPGKLARHIRRQENKLGRKATYWDVYHLLPRETRNYVPMFIATSLIASNPDAYNLEASEPGQPFEFDYVPVQGMFSLGDIAEMAGTDQETLKALNPELRGSTLPPSVGPYHIRLPLGSYDYFALNYKALPVNRKTAISQHVVRRGETLGQIARRYGISVSSLMRKNGLHSTTIRVGAHLVVPVASYTSHHDIAEAQPLRVRYGLRSIRVIEPAGIETLDRTQLIAEAQQNALELEEKKKAREKPAASTDTAAPPNATPVYYRVKRGDTLIEIARKYRVQVSQLRKWNNIRSNLIRAGQRLTIYASTSAP